MAEFKVVDRVRLIREGDKDGCPGGPKVGSEGTIEHIGESGCGRYHVEWDTYGRWITTADRLELIEPADDDDDEDEDEQDDDDHEKGGTVAETTSATKLKREMGTGSPATIERGGKTITLPDGMSYDAAIAWITRRKEEDTRDVKVFHEFERVYPLDALVAFHRALAALYNWVDNVPTPGFFGATPPTMLNIKTGPKPGDFIAVPWGNVKVPDIEGTLGVTMKDNNLVVVGTVKQGSMPRVKELLAKAEALIRTESLYRAKAVKVSWAWKRDGEPFNPMRDCPHFMDLNGASDADLVLSEDVMRALTHGLFTPIIRAAACRENRVPLKRGVLLEGPYGVGKTLTALVTAAKATAHGWTFVYLDSVLDLRDGLELARQYAPAVVFAEDIDRTVTGDRSSDMDEVLNCLDGVDTKHYEIITVLTTNHVERINRAILRPGRLDTVVSMQPPDAAAAAKLVALYGRGLLAPTTDVGQVGVQLAGSIPAVIREVVERAKIATIERLGSSSIRGHVTGEDLLAAADAMRAHAKLLVEPSVTTAARQIVLHEFHEALATNGERKEEGK